MSSLKKTLLKGSFFLILSSSVLAQGSLTPSASPAPTLKTLDEMQPRTAITSLPYSITTSGSYYLATDGVVSSTDSGITISASNVTVDLKGFTLTGSTGSLTGIIATGTPTNIHIKNGIISGWESGGINLTGATHCLIEDITVNSCTGIGVQLPENSTLQNSHITANNGDGVETVGTGASILNNEISSNTHGIDLTNGGATVDGNHCFSNSSHGINISSDENTVTNNSTLENNTGFEVTGANNHIENNYTIRNGSTADNNQILTAAETNNNHYTLLISDIPETLNRACKATLTNNVVNTVTDADGITINADNVTLDLGGFSLIGSGSSGGASLTSASNTIANYVGTGVSSDDGIFVNGSQENITIKNGYIVAWGGDGLSAFNADYSTFENLHVSFNDADGIVVDVGCVITQCVGRANGLDGLEGDEATLINNSTASHNGDNGIQTDEGCAVTNCTSFENEIDGFGIASGGTVNNCTAHGNLYHGFDLSLATVCRNSNAYDNGSSASDGATPASPVTRHAGFDLASSCVIEHCYAAQTAGHGFYLAANARVTHCKAHENDFDGIRASSLDCVLLNNCVTDNDVHGIQATSSGNILFNNIAAGNTYNYEIKTTNSYGPLIDISSAGDISSTTNADHPYANFEY